MERTRNRTVFLSLATGGFGFGLAEFSPMGILPDIAHYFNVGVPTVAYLISAYAIGVVVGAPIFALLANTVSLKRILLGLMLLFSVSSGLSAVTSSLDAMIVLRFLSGLPHGAFFGVGAILAARIAGPGRAASAFAVILMGLTVCNIVGVPVTTYVGHEFGWRGAFAIVSAVGVVTFLMIAVWVPSVDAEGESGIKDAIAVLRNANFILGFLVTTIGFGGFFSWYSYLVPLLVTKTHLDLSFVPLLMGLVGVGMTFGSHLGGRLSDRYTPIRSSIGLMMSLAILLIAGACLGSSKALASVLVFLTSVNAIALAAPMQMLLISLSERSRLLGSCIGPAAFNLGNALGAYLAGLPLASGYSYASTQWIGAAMSLGGVLLGMLLYRRLRTGEGGQLAEAVGGAG